MSLRSWAAWPIIRARPRNSKAGMPRVKITRMMDHFMTSFLRFPARLMAMIAAMTPAAVLAQTQPQTAAPQGSSPIVNAMLWMQSILLGPIATSLAVMAVAAVGFMMLTGRMNWRFGATVIIGVFIIFGAPVIVAGIAGAA